MSDQNGQDEIDKICRLADELAQSIVKMRACRCHGTGIVVKIVNGDILSEPCSCALNANQALDNWKKVQTDLCTPHLREV